MDALLFSDAAEAAFYRIVGDFFGLLPFFFAYTIYRDVLNRSKDTGSLAHWSAAKHVLIAVGIVAIFAFATGQRCPVDEFGYCIYDDWKPATSQEMLTSFIRLTVLVLGGMATALYLKQRSLG
jgi:hypothetical protein